MGRASWEVWRPRLLRGMPSTSSGLAGLPGRWPHPVVPLTPRWRPHVSPELTTMCRGGLPVERA